MPLGRALLDACTPLGMSSQNPRLAEVGRELQRSSGSACYYQARPPTASCPGLCPDSISVSPRMETPTTFLASLSVLGHLRSGKAFPDVQRGPLCFSLCPWPLALALGITDKSLVLSASHVPCRYL